MNRFVTRLMRIAWLPVDAIQSLLAVFCIIAGIILLVLGVTVIFDPNFFTQSIYASFERFSGPLVFGLTYMAGGVLSIWAPRKRPHLETVGLQLMFFSLLLTWLLTILINGLFPMSWITVAFMSFICGVIYLHRRIAI